MSNQFEVRISKHFDISVKENQTFDALFTFVDNDGLAVDLSGAVPKLIVSEIEYEACFECEDSSLESTPSITGSQNNKLQFNKTIDIPADVYLYRIYLQYPSGEIKLLLTGKFKVKEDPATGGGSSELPYKVYSALLNQTGIDAPVPTVLQNTLGGVPVWSRDGAGYYTCTLTSAFTVGKTTLQIQSHNGGYVMTTYQNDVNSVSINVEAPSLVYVDPNWIYSTGGTENGKLYETFFEIRVYP